MDSQYMGLYTVSKAVQQQMIGDSHLLHLGPKSDSHLLVFRAKGDCPLSLVVANYRQKIIKTGVFIAARSVLGNNAPAVLSNKGTFQHEKDRTQSKRTCTVRRNGRWLRYHGAR
jgi:hypothetical protein